MDEKIQESMGKSLILVFMYFQLYLTTVLTDKHAMNFIYIDLLVLMFLGIFTTLLNVFFLKLEIIHKEEKNRIYIVMLFIFLFAWVFRGYNSISIDCEITQFWVHFIGISTCILNLFLLVFYKD